MCSFFLTSNWESQVTCSQLEVKIHEMKIEKADGTKKICHAKNSFLMDL